MIDNLDPTEPGRPLLEVPRDGPRRQALLQHRRAAATSSCRPTCRRRSMRVDPKTGVLENYRARRAQLGRLRLEPEDQGALVHQPRARLGQRRHAATTRCTASAQEGHALRLSVLPPGRLPRPRVRQGPLVQRSSTRRRSSSARTSRRSACASTPARCSRPSTEQHLHRHARLVEPHDQAGLQRDARERRRQGQGRS